jgi:hypothetical protein
VVGVLAELLEALAGFLYEGLGAISGSHEANEVVCKEMQC